MRRKGYKPGSNFSVVETQKHIKDSPNYISPLSDIVMDVSRDHRLSEPEILEALKL